jgi:hypothetical protein
MELLPAHQQSRFNTARPEFLHRRFRAGKLSRYAQGPGILFSLSRWIPVPKLNLVREDEDDSLPPKEVSLEYQGLSATWIQERQQLNTRNARMQ